MVDNTNGLPFPYASYKNKGFDDVIYDYFCVATRDETGIYLFTYGTKQESSLNIMATFYKSFYSISKK